MPFIAFDNQPRKRYSVFIDTKMGWLLINRYKTYSGALDGIAVLCAKNDLIKIKDNLDNSISFYKKEL